MNTYTTTGWTAKLVIAAMTIALAAWLLEWVAGGMMYPNPETVAARKQTIEAQAEQVHQARALHEGQLKAASVNDGKRL